MGSMKKFFKVAEYLRLTLEKTTIAEFAIAISFGAAFGQLVSSLVTDIILPPFGLLFGGKNFTSLSLILKLPTDNLPAISINYGRFLDNVINLGLISFVLYFVAKVILSAKYNHRRYRSCPACCFEIPARASRCGHCGEEIPQK